MMREKTRETFTSNGLTLLRYASDGILLVSFTYISLRVFYDYQSGGNAWKQGDWLINNAGGLTRRGPFGSTIISISDLTSLSPLLLVSVFQIAFLAVLFLTFRRLALEIRNPKLSLVLISSPAIFTMFWVADPQGSVRKELIAFSGISLYALGLLREKWPLLWVGAAVFCLSTLSHEAMVLFTPMLVALFVLSRLQKTSAVRAHALGAIAITLAFSSVALLFALRNSGTADISAICATLTDRGLSESICGGAIAWLSYDSAYGFQAVTSRLGVRSLGGFLVAYLAALAPLLYIVWLSEKRLVVGAALILSALPFAPLYVVAVDWGRWMSFHIFSATIFSVLAIRNGWLPIHRTPSDHHVFSLVALGALISPAHTIGIVWGGAARRAASEFWRLL